MNIRSILLAIAAGVALGGGQQANAQYPYVPPRGPTLPRQLNYFRRDVGVLDQYNAFVQPQRQLEAQLQQMNLQQQADYRATQLELSQLRQVRQSAAAPTGVSGGFMNYSHYYRLPGAATGR
jgi:hypothetical protein